MLLRSSSTPILGSLLPSSSSSSALHHYGESPSNPHHTVSCHFSPASNGSESGAVGFRRTRSVENLFSISDIADQNHGGLLKASNRRSTPTLTTIPSFPAYGSAMNEEEADEDDEQEMESWSNDRDTMGTAVNLGAQPPLFLARGLGIDRLGSGLLNIGGSLVNDVAYLGGGGGNNSSSEKSEIEMHYKKMVEEDPTNALVLRNYAQFLYQVKGDHRRAEEYYSRAVLSDPTDGDILSEYAMLIWEVHHDEERACSYFERAARASPENSHVHAAYASFLWNLDDGDEAEGGGAGCGRSSGRQMPGAVPVLLASA